MCLHIWHSIDRFQFRLVCLFTFVDNKLDTKIDVKWYNEINRQTKEQTATKRDERVWELILPTFLPQQ